MIEVHIPTVCFYPELPGSSNQYFRYGPFLREKGVKLIVHTKKLPHHEEAELEISGIKILRYDLEEGATIQADLESLLERCFEAIASSGNEACIQPVGGLYQSYQSILKLWKFRMKGGVTVTHLTMMPAMEATDLYGKLKEILRARVILSAYSKLFLCSEIMGRAYSGYAFIPEKRMEVIPNGIDLSHFSPVAEEEKLMIRRKLGLNEQSPIVIYVGSVIPRKGVDLLIEAWSYVLETVPGATLLIVGSTGRRPTIRDSRSVSETDRYIEGVFDQIEALSIPESVIVAGEVENVRDYYRSADLFAFASWREGLPSVVLESMACGVPCVSAPFLGLPDSGEEYGVEGIHFVKSSHETVRLAADIVALLNDPEKRVKMGRAGREWISETQDIEKATDRLATVYCDIV